MSSNILGGATQGGIYFHQGGANTAENNIIVDGLQYQLCLGTAPDQVGNVLRRNVFVWREPSAKVLWDFNVLPRNSTRGSGIMPALAPAPGGSDWNLFWCTDRSVDVLGNASLFPLDGQATGGFWAWRNASGMDTHSIVADPLFVAPDQGDYTLRAGSPALSELGFQPIAPIDSLVPHAAEVGAEGRS